MKDCTNINIIRKSSVFRTLKINNNTEISDGIDIKANFINSYFSSIGENLLQRHSTPGHFDILNHIYRISPTTYSMEISITQIDLFRLYVLFSLFRPRNALIGI